MPNTATAFCAMVPAPLASVPVKVTLTPAAVPLGQGVGMSTVVGGAVYCSVRMSVSSHLICTVAWVAPVGKTIRDRDRSSLLNSLGVLPGSTMVMVATGNG